MRIFLIALCFAQLTFAEQLSGYFRKNSNKQHHEILVDNTKVKLYAYTLEVSELLSKLKTGDMITVSGEYSNDAFTASSVDFIGLRDLLGTWFGGSDTYHFQSFSKLSVVTTGDGNRVPRSALYTYSLAPDEEANAWQIFLSTEEEVLIGFIKIKKGILGLRLIDSNTGDVVKDIELSKVKGY